MHVLVTAGNTLTLIDQVRCLTNIFTGRTGAAIALEAHSRGHSVTLLTSHPEAVTELARGRPLADHWKVRHYRTFEDLEARMTEAIQPGGLDAVVHCAAVSDYLCGGVFASAPATRFDPENAHWYGDPPTLEDRVAGKVKSDEPELWIRLVRAPKLIDRVRGDWGYRGLLVKFKLEVGLSDDELLDIAERSRAQSDADLMVANTLDGAPLYAFVGTGAGLYERVTRAELAGKLLDRLEAMHPRHKR
jgi:phosphopantothenate---cysteine ligase (CTP)